MIYFLTQGDVVAQNSMSLVRDTVKGVCNRSVWTGRGYTRGVLHSNSREGEQTCWDHHRLGGIGRLGACTTHNNGEGPLEGEVV